MQDRGTAPSVTGLRNLLPCQEVANGPGLGLAIADRYQATTRSRLSKAAPKACDKEVAELTALVDRPGVSVPRDGIPPGTRTASKSLAIPGSSRLTSG